MSKLQTLLFPQMPVAAATRIHPVVLNVVFGFGLAVLLLTTVLHAVRDYSANVKIAVVLVAMLAFSAGAMRIHSLATTTPWGQLVAGTAAWTVLGILGALLLQPLDNPTFHSHIDAAPLIALPASLFGVTLLLRLPRIVPVLLLAAGVCGLGYFGNESWSQTLPILNIILSPAVVALVGLVYANSCTSRDGVPAAPSRWWWLSVAIAVLSALLLWPLHNGLLPWPSTDFNENRFSDWFVSGADGEMQARAIVFGPSVIFAHAAVLHLAISIGRLIKH